MSLILVQEAMEDVLVIYNRAGVSCCEQGNWSRISACLPLICVMADVSYSIITVLNGKERIKMH